ncbi:hypothetical protein J7426_00845 [Tropicibacter sp. R16_0]|uniref:hypothetical protein n=1 Tax=Tropicibacter sp. R16_0 TaxID=2821102 RepID=UPI001ADB244C|nr:hypothetical protein [Tropicibacter sp. R16_0]MBO9448786.1 hypothetical protein [Tropicibacter sp. R16_0]
MDIWFYVGIGLILWAIKDLFMGYTYLWEPVASDEDPWTYWTVLLVWFALGIGTVVWSLGYI